jgi:hypothetical protein
LDGQSEETTGNFIPSGGQVEIRCYCGLNKSGLARRGSKRETVDDREMVFEGDEVLLVPVLLASQFCVELLLLGVDVVHIAIVIEERVRGRAF